jgi:hypothetical protein
LAGWRNYNEWPDEYLQKIAQEIRNTNNNHTHVDVRKSMYAVDVFNDPIMALEHFKKVMTLLVRQVKKEVRNTVLFLLISECQV